MLLSQDEPHALLASLEDHEPWHFGDFETRYKPGTKDLRIVLKRLARRTFLVVDSRTQAPIEEFHFWLQWGEMEYVGGGLFNYEHHTGGRVDLAVRAGFDKVEFVAPGHADRTVMVDPSSPPESPVRVELEPEP